MNQSGGIGLASGLLDKLQKIKKKHIQVNSARKPLCGGDNLTEQLRNRI